MASAAAAAPSGSLADALARSRLLLARDPRLAIDQVENILQVYPEQWDAQLLRAEAVAITGDTAAAIETVRRLAGQRGNEASGWRLLGALLLHSGDPAGAAVAHENELRASATNPLLLQAGAAMAQQNIPEAERLLRGHLRIIPDDIAALRMLAEIAGRLKRNADAEALLRRALEIAPSFAPARYNLAIALHRQNRSTEALAEIEMLLETDPDNAAYRNLSGALRTAIGSHEDAVHEFESALARRPNQATLWMSYGHTLKTIGRQQDSITAYRRGIAIKPALGEAWWSLSNLKTFRFDAADRIEMEASLDAGELAAEDRFHLHFALGKAYEDEEAWETSFNHYAEGNRLRRSLLDYDPEEIHGHVERLSAMLTAEFFGSRAGHGAVAKDPIFVLGMPRSGSTLVEQILSSHPLVEGTRELGEIPALGHRIDRRKLRRDPSRYAETLAELSGETRGAMGEEYLARASVHRKTDRPFFIDKMPNNWAHLGLIQLILPNAKIIHTTRHPMGCCFSNFKQHFARGQAFTYSLEELGRYFVDHQTMVTQVDAALPERIHHVSHEAMVEDTETQVRALLEYCELPFDRACLRFWETERAVQTASSEQVRRPIFREGVDHWRHYEPWLGALRLALGD